MTESVFESVDHTLKALNGAGYLAGRDIATSVFLSHRLGRPLFLEGEAGVGKTALAQVLAKTLGTELIRLQCYEGLDISQSAYEWNIARQMIEIRLAEATGKASDEGFARSLYRREMLIERPLLSALSKPVAPVLLIDEIDRADEPFEAFLLEMLSEYQMSIPEFGTIKAAHPPIVILTSNRTREIHDALKRRCLYAWVDYPDVERELQIVRLRVPQASAAFARQIVEFVQATRELDLFKSPGVAETLDWANALNAMNVMALDPDNIRDTLGVLLKYQDDLTRLRDTDLAQLLASLNPAAAQT